MDIFPLLQAMQTIIPSNLTLGLVQFGTEAFFSTQNVTFGLSDYSLDLETTSGSSTAAPTSTSSSSTSASPTHKSGSNVAAPNWRFFSCIALLVAISYAVT
jgi:hypothetical protein